jgi:hypothetical protein
MRKLDRVAEPPLRRGKFPWTSVWPFIRRSSRRASEWCAVWLSANTMREPPAAFAGRSCTHHMHTRKHTFTRKLTRIYQQT